MSTFSFLGFGCGLRRPHVQYLLNERPKSTDWLEVIAENYLDWSDGRSWQSLAELDHLRNDYPITVHGVSLSLGSTDPLDTEHLKRVRVLLDRIDAAWFSEHLCWTGVEKTHLHDLLPLPYTEEALDWVSQRVLKVQELLRQPIAIENVSSYVQFGISEMAEWEFLAKLVQRTDCKLLLDINNVYVSARNHGFDPGTYLESVPMQSVVQIHLAGHRTYPTHLFDTHDQPVCDAVWDLYDALVARTGPITTMIEWDDAIPEWPVLAQQIDRCRLPADSRRFDEALRVSSRVQATAL